VAFAHERGIIHRDLKPENLMVDGGRVLRHGLRPPALRGVDSDLAAIVLKCLEKDPARRYATTGALADDLDRWMRGEAVEARAAGAAYRARKWLARRRVPAIIVGAAAAAVLAAGGAGGPWLMRAEERYSAGTAVPGGAGRLRRGAGAVAGAGGDVPAARAGARRVRRVAEARRDPWGAYDAGLADLHRAVALAPGDAAARWHRGNLRHFRGIARAARSENAGTEVRAAVEDYLEAVRLNPALQGQLAGQIEECRRHLRESGE
jgi:hypothetical protein